jgi:hypothetical protein
VGKKSSHQCRFNSTLAVIIFFALASACAPTAFASSQAVPKNSTRTAAKSDRSSVVLDGTLTILVGPDVPGPVQLAAADLANDFQTVTGKKPKIVTRQEEAGATTILIGEQSKLPAEMRPSGLTEPETFAISVHNENWNKHPTKVVVLTGSDMRGTMFAVYEFSEKYLGVDPMYYWTDHTPAHRAMISVPASLDQTYPAPLFKYRGFFINDEDQLTGWAPGEAKDKTGISLAVWDKIYETTLRLKGNMVCPGTWIFPDDPQVKEAARRGLIVTQHHAIPLGLNVARWPKDVPYNYSTHPEILERAWKNAVNEYLPHQEVVWSVGLRGLSDVTYASMDPSVRNDNKALGQLISKAFADQIGIVRAAHPDAKFVTNLWQEGAKLVKDGDLKIPPEVITVWADDGYGHIQDNGEVKDGQGIYDHIAMMNGRANQLTEMVPVERSFSELGRFIKAGATQYFLVNTSDIRAVAMSTKAVMDAVDKGLPKGADSADEFYKQWAADQFGEKAAPQLAALYKEYFKAPADVSTDPVREYGDQLYHTEARRMIMTYMIDFPLYGIPSQSPKWEPPRSIGAGFPGAPRRLTGKEWLDDTIARELKQCADAQPRWDAVWKKALAIEPLVPVARRPFYDFAVLTMIQINRDSNRALYLVSKAIQDAENGKTSVAHDEAEQAVKALEEIQKAQSAAEYGKWKNWYRGDWLTGVYRTHQLMQIFANYLEDPETHIVPPVIWDGWEAYYHIMHYEGDRSADVN